MHGGELVAHVLQSQGVQVLFTLCGGHISPILVASKHKGIRIIDTRNEVTAVFAADAVARLTGKPGVVAVTAGPGITNSITALKNAQMAQSPVIFIGGAAPTILQGRGALQDIDQMSVLRSLVKWAIKVRRKQQIVPFLEEAFRQAQHGVPGPVYIEMPIDLLYDETVVRKLYDIDRTGTSLTARAQQAYLDFHVNRMFSGDDEIAVKSAIHSVVPHSDPTRVKNAADALLKAQHPVLLIGSQAVLDAAAVQQLTATVERIGAPVYLSGMARGLLGRDHPLQIRHKRRDALREADCVLLVGVPVDFRLDYGNHIRRSVCIISLNRSRSDLTKNRQPTIGILGDAATSLHAIAALLPNAARWQEWTAHLHQRDDARNAAIALQMQEPMEKVNPMLLCREIDTFINPDTILIGDGGDFVATASYIIQPAGPLQWLDPGVFGTLGVGAGFALGAKLVHPESEVVVLFGDGSVGYSLTEFDTFVRHQIPIIAIVGNDASWSQIAREQVDMFHDDVGTVLAHTNYDQVVEGFGGVGFRIDNADQIAQVLSQARTLASSGKPVLINVILGASDFRKGSISM